MAEILPIRHKTLYNQSIMCLKLTFKVRQNLNTDLDIRNILRGPDIGGQFGPRKSVFAVHLQHSTRGDSDKFLSEFVHFVLAKITCLFLMTGVYLSGTQDNKEKIPQKLHDHDIGSHVFSHGNHDVIKDPLLVVM